VSQIKKLKKTSDYSPNAIAVVSFPDFDIPTRAYFFSNNLDKTFGSLEKAIKFSEKIMKRIPKNKEIFQIGFVFGNNFPDKDIFMYPFEYSGKNSSKIRSTPYIIKNGTRRPWPIREKLDEFSIILDDEQINLRKYGLENHKRTFPELTRLKYID